MKLHTQCLAELRMSSRAGMAAATAIALSVMGTLPALAQQSAPYYGSQMWGGGWGMIFGPFIMILVVAAVVVVVVLLVRSLGGPSAGDFDRLPPTKSALEILKERYARGEIDKEEYEERRRVLGG